MDKDYTVYRLQGAIIGALLVFGLFLISPKTIPTENGIYITQADFDLLTKHMVRGCYN